MKKAILSFVIAIFVINGQLYTDSSLLTSPRRIRTKVCKIVKLPEKTLTAVEPKIETSYNENETQLVR